jgi:hypothetical protein
VNSSQSNLRRIQTCPPKIDRRASLILCLVLSCYGFILNGQVWGTSDTLRPAEDGAISWNHTGCDAGSRYDCVNDITPDLDTTKAYTSAVAKSEEFFHDSTYVSNIDSVVIRIHAKKAGISTVWLQLGWASWIEGMWIWHPADSVTLTDLWGDYSVTTTTDEGGNPWTYQKINALRFGVQSGDNSGIWSANVTQIFIIVFYKEAIEAKGKGGIVQDEDNRGITEGGIAK